MITLKLIKNDVNRILLFLFITCILFACKQDQGYNNKPVAIGNIIGKWNVEESYRNNRLAKSLANAKFDITDSTFSCNFLDDSKSFPYSFDGKIIKVLNPDENNYSVRMLTPDTLILTTEIKNFDFRFISVKKQIDDQDS